MKQDYPPIVRLAERLVVALEECVRRFSRYHKYTLGTELRQQAHHVYRLAYKAWRDKAKQLDWLTQLVWAVDDLKLSLQLGQQLKAFASFGQFEQLAILAADMGKQTGGWYKQQVRGQKSAPSAEQARPQILSSHTTPAVQL